MYKFGRPVFCQLRITGAGAGILIVCGKSPVPFQIPCLIMDTLNKRIGFYVNLIEVSQVLFNFNFFVVREFISQGLVLELMIPEHCICTICW